MLHDIPWMEHALCSDHQELGWIKDRADVGLGEEATMAVACGRCPVRLACAAYVERNGITGGFWAGEHRDETPERLDGAA
jgi:hypothetical protein